MLKENTNPTIFNHFRCRHILSKKWENQQQDRISPQTNSKTLNKLKFHKLIIEIFIGFMH